MYQIKCGRYQIQVIGRGDNGLCRIEHDPKGTVFSGTYIECVSWLEARGIKVS